MYTPGQMQMQSAMLLQNYAGDRPSFQAIVCRTFSTRPFQVFAMPQGLLFLELRKKGGMGGGGDNDNMGAIIMGGMLGGVIGACIAQAMTSNPAADASRMENFDTYTEDELFRIAASRKRSFVAKNEEILHISIDAPTTWNRMFANRSLAGFVTLRDRKLGKITMEVHDQAAMSVAVDALPRRYAERVAVNVVFDRNSTEFVALR
jgi:hypothetical protein